MLQNWINEESSLPWCSPIVAVLKTHGSLWICSDFHSLKQVIELECYPLPKVNDLIDQLRRACFITRLDLKKGIGRWP